MKKLLTVLALVFATIMVNAQAQIDVNKETHDYGEMVQGGDPYCEFVVTNTGTEPLIISNAKGSCGCTVPEWTKEPILPGKTSIIKVRYDTKRVGPINKSVTITSNAENEPTKILRIKGNIKATTAPAAPVKESGATAPKAN